MTAPLDQLLDLVGPDMDRVNQTIVDRMASPVALIPQLASYIVASGGKRLRPLLTLAIARHLGHAGDDHVKLAAAVEFIHTATLLHDDVVDESALRRGQSSANEVFGNQSSVLVGDFLFARAFQLMVETGSVEVLGILARASTIISEGEVLQLSAANDLGTTEAIYLEVIRSKTAALFEAACEAGAVIAGAGEAVRGATARYGLALGIAFQLADDVLDYSAEQGRLGKTVGDDFREGKVTLPVILAFAAGDEAERAFWRRTIEESEVNEGDLDRAMALIARHDGLTATMARAGVYVSEAEAALADVPSGRIREALAAVARFTVDREY